MASWSKPRDLPGLRADALAIVLAAAIHLVVQELRLREQREKALSAELTGLLNAASLSAIVSTDREGSMTSFSRGAEEVLGYPADEVVGIARPELFLDPRKSRTSPPTSR